MKNILQQSSSTKVLRKQIGNLVIENIPELPISITERLQQYQNIRSAFFLDWDAQGQGMYITTRFGDTAQVHHVAKPGAYRRQVTFFKEPIDNISVCPNKDKDGFIFMRDTGGNERYQIYYFDNKTSKWQLISDGESRHTGVRWNKKGTTIVYSANKQNEEDMSIYTCPIDNPANEQLVLLCKGGGWSVVDWTEDESLMLLHQYISINESKIYILETQTQTLTQINSSEKQVSYHLAKFCRNNTGIFFTSDEDSEFASLRFYKFDNKEIINITKDINWDIVYYHIAPDNKHLVFEANVAGYSKLYQLNTKTFRYKILPNLPTGVSFGFKYSPDSKKIALNLSTPNSQCDAYTINLQRYNIEQWTFSETGGLNTAKFIEPTLIAYPTFDTLNERPRMIPAFWYQPKNKQEKTPVVIYIHGGPEGQTQPNFSPLFNFLSNELGIAVIAPNVRGSTGYGKKYVQLDNGYLRENSVKDIGALLDWIENQPQLDETKVAVWGGSYGGYMSLACLTHYSHRLACGIDLFGISNFVTFLKNTGAYRRDLRRVEYGDERDPKMYQFLIQISPLTNITNITKPLFIFQGLNDPRVPLGESEQMVEALRDKGNTVWYVLANDEGHGITKKTNRDYVNAAMILFLEQYLLKK